MKKHNSKLNNKKLLMGNGKEYSSIAKEIENVYTSWLRASGICEAELLRLVEREDFYLTFWADETMALTILHHAIGEIGMPLVWQKESGIDFNSYKVDTGLLLMLIASKCSSQTAKDKIKSFVSDKLCVK